MREHKIRISKQKWKGQIIKSTANEKAIIRREVKSPLHVSVVQAVGKADFDSASIKHMSKMKNAGYASSRKFVVVLKNK